jgi:hypothetical protein
MWVGRRRVREEITMETEAKRRRIRKNEGYVPMIRRHVRRTHCGVQAKLHAFLTKE